MKKLLTVLHNFNKKLAQYCSDTAIGKVLSAIILAAAVACATSMADGIKAEYAERDFYNDLILGYSKAYVEDILGHPRIIIKHLDEDYMEDIIECQYIAKHSIMRIFYVDDLIIGFFITSNNRNYKKIGTSKLEFTEGKPLGSFTFKMLNCTPSKILSYQLEDEYTYLEKYDSDSNTCYYIYNDSLGFTDDAFTTEEELRNDSDLQHLDSEDILLDYENIDSSVALFPDRNKLHPNTYGKCIMEYSNPIEDIVLHTYNYLSEKIKH